MNMYRAMTAVVTMAFLIASSLYGAVGTGESTPSRGSFGTHDAGNFTINIGDDGGATGWDTLEFPPGEDRLSSAYFGIGTGADSVDFGDHNEFRTVDPLNISSPGYFTDEEGYCSFSGWTGEDFDDAVITQRTFVNRHVDEKRGHTGRWMVIDYEIELPSASNLPVYLLQTMNVDLGSSASDDMFTFIPSINTTAISDGATFIGLGYFSLSSDSRYFGHSAGAYGPGVYSGESQVFDHMSSPNEQGTSTTAQDWYMDISAKVDAAHTSSSFHVSFIVLVGSSVYQLREAYFDAVNGLRGNWTGPVIDDWQSGGTELVFEYNGPIFPPYETNVLISSKEMEGDWGDNGLLTPEPVPGTRNMSLSLNTSAIVSDWGDVRWDIFSSGYWGFFDEDPSGTFRVDNRGPGTVLEYENRDPAGTLLVRTSADDRGGSGTAATYMSMDGEFFIEARQLEIFDDGTYDLFSYSVDAAGNKGPASSIFDVINDGTPPSMELLSASQQDLTEDSEGPLTLVLSIDDALSGLDPSTLRYRAGINEASTGQWQDLVPVGEDHEAEILRDWEALQGSHLVVEIEASDMLGNRENITFEEYVDPMNDPPEFTLELSGEQWFRQTIGMTLSGRDPDGDGVTFSFEIMYGAGEWTGIPSSDLEEVDATHFIYDVPDRPETLFEGTVTIRGTAGDGKTTSPIPPVSVQMDRKPPSLDVTGIPTVEWSGSEVRLEASASDGLSGVREVFYTIESSGRTEGIPGPNIGLGTDGYLNVTVRAEDGAGNIRTLKLDTIKVDRTLPVIDDIILDPEEPVPGDDLTVGFTAFDRLSLPYSTVAQEPSMFIEAELLLSDGTSVEGTITTDTSVDNGFRALFEDPFGEDAETCTVNIRVTDKAGNTALETSGPHDLVLVNTFPFEIDHPETVEAGEDFTINITWEGRVVLEVLYPEARINWIFLPVRTSGEMRTYELPGPFAPGEITFTVKYREPGSEEDNLSAPSEISFTVTITGWSDSDGDGLSDAYEERFGLDPDDADDLSSDGDLDELELSEEMIYMTDPDVRDTDGDGMHDSWEAAWGTIPSVDDGDDDPDDDGWSNYREFLDGTDPRDPESYPEEPPATPWYWIVIIFAVLLAILGYFVFQMINRRKFEDDLEAMDEKEDWEGERS